MVARLRAKPGGDRSPWWSGDMAELDLRASRGGATLVRLVFAAVNTFFNLTTADAQPRCFGAVARRAGRGRLRSCVEAFVPAEPTRPASSVDARTLEMDRVVLTVSRHDRVAQPAVGQLVELRDGGRAAAPVAVRYAPPERARRHGPAAGLGAGGPVERWRGTPFTATTARTCRCTRVAPESAGSCLHGRQR